MTYSGRYSPQYPAKYMGDPTQVFYRSMWERQVMKFLDLTETVVSWSSEEIVIPYRSPLDNRGHRYFPDFLMRIKNADGSISTVILEVKPHAQTKPPTPTPTSRQTKRYVTEVCQWGVNEAKWAAARQYCAVRGWTFAIGTEKTLPFVR